MNIKELEKVLKICVKLGISEIKLADTHVIFGEASKLPRKPRKAARREQQEVADKAYLQQTFNEVTSEIETSHLEDPVGYEEALLAGELGDAKAHNSRTQ